MAPSHQEWYKITMSWQSNSWQIPLDARPAILHMGVGRHGTRRIERYQLDGLWSLHLYPYEAEVEIDGVRYPINPGYAGITPPDARVEYRYSRPVRHLYAHFAFPEETQETRTIPAMQDLGSQFVMVNQRLEQASGYFPTQRRRAEARLWDILWDLTVAPAMNGATSSHHPAVDKVCSIIEIRLAEPLRIPDLAREVGLSHNQLIRLFRATFGTTVVGFIQERRVQRSKHLLLHSTLPIKVIAAEVGMADLHFFNKTIRRTLGASPRQIRERQSTAV
jgi:AraC-like DNA-binding protein